MKGNREGIKRIYIKKGNIRTSMASLESRVSENAKWEMRGNFYLMCRYVGT